SMQPLVQRLNLVQRSAAQAEFERRQARAVSAQAAYQRIQQLYQDGLLSQHSWQIMAPLLEQRGQVLADAVKEVLRLDPRLEADEISAARREALRAQRGTLRGLLAGGVISEEIYAELKGEVDMALTENPNPWPGQPRGGPSDPGSIRRLIMAVIQLQDVENAMSSLNKAGLAVTRLPSTGGFLGRRNVTLLIGMPEGQEETAIRVLSKSCHRRVEYVATPLEGAPFPLPLSTPINVGGATIFTLEVERYEEI
ncbi:MAG TPA: cyclic-di-AMP receptor, partial [Anaerolineaceae bacterium]